MDPPILLILLILSKVQEVRRQDQDPDDLELK
jgi:hypothetical protein